MPASPQQRADHLDKLERVSKMVAQGLNSSTIATRLGTSRGRAVNLMRLVREGSAPDPIVNP